MLEYEINRLYKRANLLLHKRLLMGTEDLDVPIWIPDTELSIVSELHHNLVIKSVDIVDTSFNLTDEEVKVYIDYLTEYIRERYINTKEVSSAYHQYRKKMISTIIFDYTGVLYE